MIFESLINPAKAEKNPLEMVLVGFVYASIAVLLSITIFKRDASLVMIFLTVMACSQLVYWAIRTEEKKDVMSNKKTFLLKEHGKALSFLMFLFLGFVFAFSFWYLALPENMSQNLFSTQLSDIRGINSPGISGDASSHIILFREILLNNLMVLGFCLLFSLLYGIGAIFILCWNASVIAAAIGTFVQESIGLHYVASVPLAMMRYGIHGIPEIFAYMTAGLAGGIISIAVIRHDYGSTKFVNVMKDSIDLILISIITLIAAALIEVYITPVLF